MYDIVIKNGRLVTQDRVYKADIAIKDGKFAAFASPGTFDGSNESNGSNECNECNETIDAKGNYVFPGIIDCHAHLNEPGFEYREDFETGSRAAVSAGCTTLIDMPLNNDPSLLNKDVFDLKMSKISTHSAVDYALWGGIVGDYEGKDGALSNNLNDLVDLHKCGVAAFKGFTCPNGPLFPTVNMGHVRKALEILKPYGALCGFHCEEFGQVSERTKEAKARENRTREEKISDFLKAHDVWTEYVAAKNVMDMAKATGGRVHICHVTHPMVAQAVKEAMHEGVLVTAETCPHYLGFTEEFVFEKGAPAKCTPPMRTKEDMEKLWDYVLDGTLSCVGSDHSPAADEEKDNSALDIWQAWGGLNSISFFLPMMFDMVVHKRGLSPTLITRVMDYNPAKVFGLYGRKGAFELGFDGDVVIVDPEKPWKCEQEKLFTKGHVSCFDGLEGKGSPICTIIRGRVVAKDGVYRKDAVGYGQYITPVK